VTNALLMIWTLYRDPFSNFTFFSIFSFSVLFPMTNGKPYYTISFYVMLSAQFRCDKTICGAYDAIFLVQRRKRETANCSFSCSQMSTRLSATLCFNFGPIVRPKALNKMLTPSQLLRFPFSTLIYLLGRLIGFRWDTTSRIYCVPRGVVRSGFTEPGEHRGVLAGTVRREDLRGLGMATGFTGIIIHSLGFSNEILADLIHKFVTTTG
jgi:hypothetical protein